MSYKIIVSPRAQNEIEDSIDFYYQRSRVSAENFISAISDTYEIISKNPHFQIVYKNVHAFRLQKFPFSLFFMIDEKKTLVRVLSCFHTSRNPCQLA